MNKKLQHLYDEYDIKNLSFGILGDKLGDVYEDFVVEIFQDKDYIENFERLNLSNVEETIFKTILKKEGIESNNNILNIEATTDIPKRKNGANAKTDVLVNITYKNGQVRQIPISVKQTTASKVAFAEFDVDTILNEVGINNEVIERLMKKHQVDASAKKFTKEEKDQLRSELAQYKEKFLRWIMTMSPVKNDSDVRIPKYIIRFQLTKGDHKILKMKVCVIEECITDMASKRGGFGTGLAWTYATGSKGRKIQFKG